MRTNKALIIFFLLMGLISIRTQCNKDFDVGPNYKYSFQEKASVSPYKLNYNTGDTIWIRINIPEKKLFDEITGTRVFFDSAGFTTNVQVFLLYNNPFIANGPFVKFIFSRGVSAYINNGGGQPSAQISYGCAPSNDYNMLVGIILLEKGVFGISVSNYNIQKCIHENYLNSSLSLSFDVSDTHKEFYQQLPLAEIGKKHNESYLQMLDKKTMIALNVQ
jgi:hypothetical protein